MNVLLIYPEIPATFWSFHYALKFVRKKASNPPLGIVTVASMLPKEWNKKLVDMNVTELTEEDLNWADYAGPIVQQPEAPQQPSMNETIRQASLNWADFAAPPSLARK